MNRTPVSTATLPRQAAPMRQHQDIYDINVTTVLGGNVVFYAMGQALQRHARNFPCADTRSASLQVLSNNRPSSHRVVKVSVSSGCAASGTCQHSSSTAAFNTLRSVL